MSAHPNNLKRYTNTIAGKSAANEFANAGLGLLKNFFKAFLNPDAAINGDFIKPDIDVLFVSHFLTKDQATQTHDLYYGDLPRKMAALNISAATVLIDHSHSSWKEIHPSWKNLEQPRSILNSANSIGEEWSFFREGLAACLSTLRTQHASVQSALARNFRRHAAASCLSPETMQALRIQKRIGDVVKAVKPSLLVTTYEGHGWERLVYKSARDVHPDIICAGYHHAVLFPEQQSMTSRLNDDWDADIILTAGEPGHRFFQNVSEFNDRPIDILGSARSGSEELSLDIETKNKSRQCLFLPEGIISESQMLTALAIELAKKRPDLSFIVRCHPLINASDIEDSNIKLDEAPANFSFSNNTFDTDIGASRWAVYRGSSAIITAGSQGVLPIYFAQESDVLAIAPLSQMDDRNIAGTANDALKVISSDLQRSPEERTAVVSAVKTYCDNYFKPFDPDVLVNCLKKSPSILKIT